MTYETIDRGILIDHMMDNHPDLTLLNTVAGQLSSLSDSFAMFEVFKVELKDVLNKIIDDHNSVKQELFVIRNSQIEEVKKIDVVEKAIEKLVDIVTKKTSKEPSVSTSQESAKTAPSEKKASKPPSQSNSSDTNRSTPKQPDSHSTNVPKLSKPDDSITNCLNTGILIQAADIRISQVKA